MDIITFLIKENNEYTQLDISPPDLKDFFSSVSDEEGLITKEIKMIALTETELSDDKITFIMSDESLNRYDFRVKTEGIKLKNFKKNPVLLWAHDTYRPAIGKIENVRIKDKKLLGDAIFAPPEVDGFAWSIEQKIRMGIISAGSIGFKILEVDIPKKPKADGTTMTITAGDLEEFSICNVPANPNALVISKTLSIDEEAKDNTKELQDSVSVPVVKIDYIDLLFSDRSRKTSDLENLLKNEGENINSLFGETNGI